MVRTNIKQRAIVGELRRRIVTGVYAPGTRFPTHSQIRKEFDVSPPTVQVAINQLVADQFITVQSTRGTYVAASPPHLVRYAVVFDGFPDQRDKWSQFYTVVANEAINLNRGETDVQVTVHYGVTDHHDNKAYQQLCADVSAHRLAGVIFSGAAGAIAPMLFYDQCELPKVMIGPTALSFPHVPAVAVDTDSFMNRAVERLVSRGRRRIAVATIRSDPQGMIDQLRSIPQLLARHGATTRPFWIQGCDSASAQWMQQSTHLLMQGHERPDGLIIADDNLVEPAVQGLIDAGIRESDKLEIIAYTNFPSPIVPPLPVTRLGFDSRQILRTCIDVLNAQREGRGVKVTHIPAVFAEELSEAAIASPFGAGIAAVGR